MTSASEVYIQATETDPVAQVRAAVGAIHQAMLDGPAGLAELSGAPAAEGTALVGYRTGELRRRLTATDEALYAAASGALETRLLVRGLRTTARALHRRVEALVSAEPTARADAAAAIESVLDAHLTVERTVLLPALAALPGAGLPTLVGDLRTPLEGGRLERPPVVDAREIPHGRRRPRILARCARLAPGEAFTLVDNHDPSPLRREFQATHPGAFTWEYLEPDPERWQVRIGRVADGA